MTRINGKLDRIVEMLNYDESEVVKGLACAGGAVSGYLDTLGIGNSQRDKMEAISTSIARLRKQQSEVESELQGLQKARVLAMLTHNTDDPTQVLMKKFPKGVAEGFLELFGPNGKAFKIEHGFF